MLRRTARRDRMIGLFAAGAVLLNPPILNLVRGSLFGIPARYLYFFLVWALLIGLMAFVGERGSASADERGRGRPRR